MGRLFGKMGSLGAALLLSATCLSPASAADRLGTGAPDSISQQVKDFMALVGGRDFATAGLIRWEKPVRVGILSADRIRDIPLVERELADLRALTGHDISLVDERANVVILFTAEPKEDLFTRYLSLLRTVLPQSSDPRTFIASNVGDGIICFPIYYWGKVGKQKTLARGLIALRQDLDGPTTHSCLSSLFLQVLGFVRQMEEGRPSVLSHQSGMLEPSTHDRRLLRTLYDPRLQSGMSPPAVEAAVKEVLATSDVTDTSKVVELFMRTAIGETQGNDRIRKWQGPLRLSLLGKYEPERIEQVRRLVGQLARYSGLDFRLAEKDEVANVSLLFTDDPVTDLTGPYRDLAMKFFHEPVETAVTEIFERSFTRVNLDGNAITGALAVLPRPTSLAASQYQLTRSLAMALGVALKAGLAADSALSAYSVPIHLTETDLRIIAALYAPEVRPGMTRDEAKRVASKAIARMMESLREQTRSSGDMILNCGGETIPGSVGP